MLCFGKLESGPYSSLRLSTRDVVEYMDVGMVC